VSSKTEKALPGSDIGLNATIEMAYLWVMCALSLPNIHAFFNHFKTLSMSTAGISKMMIRLRKILDPVYEEIRNDVKQGTALWADETGWRVNGKLWWLWRFANKRSACYRPDKSRGGQVVESILGTIFYGILRADGWHAYNKWVCARQTCMAHIFRKSRAFIEAYPQYRSIMQFYLKLRRIIREGETLQAKRSELDALSFQRRLKTLQQRLHDLLAWKNPNSVLANAIKKVRRQEAYILSFVEHSEGEHHNNYAEFIIKKGILKRKISGGSKSVVGVRAYAVIQSIAMTCQLRRLSFCHFVKESLLQYIRTGKPMLLAEYEALFQIASNAA
jgi:transposase